MNSLDPLEREPAWLSSAVDQRVAFMANVVGRQAELYDVIMLMLTEPPEWANENYRQKWNHSCDRCHVLDPNIVIGNVVRTEHGKKVVVVFGVCPECLALP